MLPTLFCIDVNGLLREMEKCPSLGVKFFKNTMSGFLIANGFIKITDTGLALG